MSMSDPIADMLTRIRNAQPKVEIEGRRERIKTGEHDKDKQNGIVGKGAKEQ